MIVIIDYGMGNLKSVENACAFLGKRAKISDSKDIIKKAKKIIFPGVGHFAQAVAELKRRRIFNVLAGRIKENVPFLGICLGMQLLLEQSQEAPGVGGLGVIKGEVKRFKAKNLIIPHMGWNQIQFRAQGTREERRRKRDEGRGIFRGVRDGEFFYFAHSYYCASKEKDTVLTTTNYSEEFASSLHKDNVWAVQFHPEKSQKLGLKVLSNFLQH